MIASQQVKSYFYTLNFSFFKEEHFKSFRQEGVPLMMNPLSTVPKGAHKQIEQFYTMFRVSPTEGYADFTSGS